MIRSALSPLSLCACVFLLGACQTPDSASSLDVVPSGSYSRPLSDVQPASKEESNARVHIEVGQQYFSIGRMEIALDETRKALQFKSDYPPAYHLMGLVYMALNQNDQADDAFRRALSDAPGDPEFNNSYGWFLCTNKRLPEALSRFANSAANPYYRFKTRPYANAGLCLLQYNELERAEVQFSRALEADSSNGEALYRLAEVAYRRGNYRRAHDLLIQYHQNPLFAPDSRSVWLGLLAARRLGEHHAGASYVEQLRGRFADSRENALMMQGKYEIVGQVLK